MLRILLSSPGLLRIDFILRDDFYQLGPEVVTCVKELRSEKKWTTNNYKPEFYLWSILPIVRGGFARHI